MKGGKVENPLVTDDSTSDTHPRAPEVVCLYDWFHEHVGENADRPFLTGSDGTWSRLTSLRWVSHLSAILRFSGDVRGQRIGFLGFDDPMVFIALFAAAGTGSIFVPLNFRLSAREMLAIVADADIQILLVDKFHRSTAAIIEDRAKHVRVVDLEDVKASFGPQLPAAGGSPSNVAERPTADDVVLILYTSGTTGIPKGVQLTHGNLWFAAKNSIMANSLGCDDIALNCTPLFHSAGLNSLCLPVMMAGGQTVLMPHFDEDSYLTAVQRYSATVSLLVPSMMVRLLEHNSFSSSGLTSLRLVLTGGAPVPRIVLEGFNSRGVVTSQGYGATETTSAVTILRPEDAVEKQGSCGQRTPLSELKLMDPTGAEISEPFQAGELLVRGPMVARGYWRRPDETATAFDMQGWFRSGDSAYFDGDGYYYICGRLKDMIITGGENVYAAEVENALYECELLAEVAVIGCADPVWGECVTAILVPKSHVTLDTVMLATFARARIAGYKVPKRWYVTEVLPKTASGKVSKEVLRSLISDERLTEYI